MKAPSTPSLALLALATGLAGACYKPPEIVFEDRGADPGHNPYIQSTFNRSLSTGPVAGFRDLYVEAEGFGATLAPVRPLPAIEPPPLELPEGFLPAAEVRLTVPEANVAAIAARLREASDAPIAAYAEGRVLLVSGGSEERVAALADLPLAEADDAPALSTVAEVSLATELPDDLLRTRAASDVDGLLTLEKGKPVAPRGGRADLLIDNHSVTFIEVSVNGTRVGSMHPWGLARIEGVKPGIYELTWFMPNGFEFSEEVEARPQDG